eukprot:3158713-Pyramimonas_sp.AAC.1
MGCTAAKGGHCGPRAVYRFATLGVYARQSRLHPAGLEVLRDVSGGPAVFKVCPDCIDGPKCTFHQRVYCWFGWSRLCIGGVKMYDDGFNMLLMFLSSL